MVEKVAGLAIETALHGEATIVSHRWNELLNHEIKRPSVSKPARAD
jgi:hypothetical protein